MRVTVPVAVVLPDVPVTVTTYVPAVVPGLPPPPTPPPPPPPPPHAMKPPMRITRKTSRPSRVRQRRRRPGMPIPSSKPKARVVPPAYQRTPGRAGGARAALVAAVVETVKVAVTAELPVTLTGVVAPKLRVGASCAPLGAEVMAAESETLPVNPLLGVTVTVEVLPVVAPGDTETAVPVIVKPGGLAVTVKVAGVEVEAAYVLSPL